MVEIIDLLFQNTPQSTAAFFVPTKEGPVIVETGPHSTLPQIEQFLKKKKYRLSDVKHVFITHIHLDHAGAAWAFAKEGATIYLHPFGEKHMIDPSKLLSSAKRIYKDKMKELWGELHPIPSNQLQTLANGEKISIGDTDFIAWYTPGHAVHHLSVQIGKELIAGDVAGVKIGESGMVVPPCPPPDINIEHWMNSIAVLEELELEAVYLTHFGKVTDLPTHFAALKFILKDWSNWVHPYFKEQTPLEEIVPKFNAYTLQQLKDFGVEQSILSSYEKSNPVAMSIVGLLRYWKKKYERMEAEKA